MGCVLLDPPAGCAWVGCRTPRYTPQIENIQILKYGSFHSVRLSAFQAKGPDVNSVWLRAISPMKSSVGTFEQYLEQALRQELQGPGGVPQAERRDRPPLEGGHGR